MQPRPWESEWRGLDLAGCQLISLKLNLLIYKQGFKVCVRRFIENTFVCITWLITGTSLVAITIKIYTAHSFGATYVPDLLMGTYVPSYFI